MLTGTSCTSSYNLPVYNASAAGQHFGIAANSMEISEIQTTKPHVILKRLLCLKCATEKCIWYHYTWGLSRQQLFLPQTHRQQPCQEERTLHIRSAEQLITNGCPKLLLKATCCQKYIFTFYILDVSKPGNEIQMKATYTSHYRRIFLFHVTGQSNSQVNRLTRRLLIQTK